jgi:hypothetical protein
MPTARCAAGRDDDLRAEEAHQLAPLDAERLRHRQHAGIALGRADHGEADAGVAARRLDHRLARLQLAGLLARLDHRKREAILDRSQRIEGLHLDPEVDALRPQPIDLDQGVLPMVSRMLANRFDMAVLLRQVVLQAASYLKRGRSHLKVTVPFRRRWSPFR